MILTLIAYGIYTQIRDETRDPETDESISNLLLHVFGLVLFWPIYVIPLGTRLATQRQQHIWYIGVFNVALVSVILGLIPYLLLGLLVLAVAVFGYIYYGLKIYREREAASHNLLDENWE